MREQPIGRGFLAVAMAFLGLAACDLVFDPSGLIGAPPPDAAAEADAPQADAGAGDAGEGGTWCTTQPPHLLCEDFDTDDLAEKWVLGGARRDLDASWSAPASLLAEVPALGSAYGGSSVSRTFTLNPRSAHLEFMFRFNGAPDAGYGFYARIFAYGGQFVALRGSSGTWQLNVVRTSGQDFGPQPFAPPDAGAWTKIDLDVVFDTKNGRAVFSYDGVVQGNEFSATIDPSDAGPETKLEIGFTGGQTGTVTEARFDDVVFDVDAGP